MKQFFTFLGIVAMGATAYGQADTDIVNIPDENFKRALLGHNIDTNEDREISYGEARAYTGYLNIMRKGISSLTGIEAFVNITDLSCVDNEIKTLDLSNNIHLKSLYCRGNELVHLNIEKNTELEVLKCSANQLTSLDISKNTKLRELEINNNFLTNIDVSKALELEILYCWENQLLDLDVSKNIKLKELDCKDNKLTSLDVSKNIELTFLQVSINELTALDLSKNKNLETLVCIQNKLQALDLSKNPVLRYLDCRYNNLSQLNLANGNNLRLKEVYSWKNAPLKCIQIDSGISQQTWWSKDAHSYYSDNCNYNLSTDEVKTENHLQILNPIKDNLIIKTTAKVEKVEIYNTAGQLVKVLFRGNTQVQDLAKGIYLIKITTDKGVITEKIIKQ